MPALFDGGGAAIKFVSISFEFRFCAGQFGVTGDKPCSDGVGERSDAFGTRSDALGMRSDAFGIRSDGFGMRSDGFRLRADGFGTASDGFRFRADAFGRRILVPDLCCRFFRRRFYAKPSRFISRFLKRNGVDRLVFGTVRAVFALDESFKPFGAVADAVGVEIKNLVARDAVSGKIGGGFD